jgi:hypothetical protein
MPTTRTTFELNNEFRFALVVLSQLLGPAFLAPFMRYLADRVLHAPDQSALIVSVVCWRYAISSGTITP